jgi:hypothetical protein
MLVEQSMRPYKILVRILRIRCTIVAGRTEYGLLKKKARND